MDRERERSNTGQQMDSGLEQRMEIVLEQRLNMLELKMERILDHIKWLEKIVCLYHCCNLWHICEVAGFL